MLSTRLHKQHGRDGLAWVRPRLQHRNCWNVDLDPAPWPNTHSQDGERMDRVLGWPHALQALTAPTESCQWGGFLRHAVAAAVGAAQPGARQLWRSAVATCLFVMYEFMIPDDLSLHGCTATALGPPPQHKPHCL